MTDPTGNYPRHILDQIEQLAQSYWEAEGRPENQHLQHWLRAEAAVLAGPPPPATE